MKNLVNHEQNGSGGTDIPVCAKGPFDLHLFGWRTRFVALAFAVTVLLPTSRAQAVEVVCHRGANKLAPENTLAAAQACIDLGCEWVEIDIRTSQDGVLYILHDATVDRTTDGVGVLRKLTSDQIDALDAGSWYDPKFAGEHVPRVKPYLEWIKGKAKVYFDVKDCDLKQLIDLVYELKMENDCFFWFGNPLHAIEFRKLDEKLPLKINVRNADDVARAQERFKASIIETGLGNMSPELVEACKQRNIRIMIRLGENDPEAFRKVIRWKADMINLDFPDVFKQVERDANAASK